TSALPSGDSQSIRSTRISFMPPERLGVSRGTTEFLCREGDSNSPQVMVYKTTDGGEHWTQIWQGDNLARYVWIDPGNRNLLYVSTGFFDREDAQSNPVANLAGGVGILKSTDGGQTWRVLNQTNGLGNLYVGSL